MCVTCDVRRALTKYSPTWSTDLRCGALSETAQNVDSTKLQSGELISPTMSSNIRLCWLDGFRVAEFLLVYPSDSDAVLPSSIDVAPQSPATMPSGSFTTTATDVTMSAGEPGPSTRASSSRTLDLPSLGLRDEEPMDEETADLFMIARSLYDAKEHERVDYLLRFVKHPKARFLGLYSRYIVR